MTLTLRANRELVGGVDCYIIDGRGEDGEYTVWLDPSRGCALRRVEFKKNENDRFYDRRLRQPDPELVRVMPRQAFAPENIILSMHTTMEILDFADEGGRSFPTAGRITSEFSYADGHARTVVNEIRQRADWNPKLLDEHRFELPPIPDGCEVLVRGDQTGVKHEWRGGRIVDKINLGK